MMPTQSGKCKDSRPTTRQLAGRVADGLLGKSSIGSHALCQENLHYLIYRLHVPTLIKVCPRAGLPRTAVRPSFALALPTASIIHCVSGVCVCVRASVCVCVCLCACV